MATANHTETTTPGNVKTAQCGGQQFTVGADGVLRLITPPRRPGRRRERPIPGQPMAEVRLFPGLERPSTVFDGLPERAIFVVDADGLYSVDTRGDHLETALMFVEIAAKAGLNVPPTPGSIPPGEAGIVAIWVEPTSNGGLRTRTAAHGAPVDAWALREMVADALDRLQDFKVHG
jgi:hypothetical protein